MGRLPSRPSFVHRLMHGRDVRSPSPGECAAIGYKGRDAMPEKDQKYLAIRIFRKHTIRDKATCSQIRQQVLVCRRFSVLSLLCFRPPGVCALLWRQDRIVSDLCPIPKPYASEFFCRRG
jgi:hypothetical protein